MRLLWGLFVIILIFWILGFALHLAGAMIHLLLVLAAIILIINLIAGRRAV
jgi:hypothetical protein